MKFEEYHFELGSVDGYVEVALLTARETNAAILVIIVSYIQIRGVQKERINDSTCLE